MAHDSWSSVGMATFVYAKCTRSEHRALWSNLVSITGTATWPWIVGGDFNVISSVLEYVGRAAQDLGAIADFNETIQGCSLTEVPFSGSFFTWTGVRAGTRVWKRLDRPLVNQAWLDFAATTTMQHLSRTASEHSPLLLTIRKDGAWVAKQRELEVQQRETEYKALQTDDARSVLHRAQAQLLSSLRHNEEFWQQKARIKWAKDGDSNTSFFHAAVQDKRAKLAIHRIKDNAWTWVEEDEQIAAVAERFFKDLLFADKPVEAGALVQHIPSLVTRDQNKRQLEEVTLEEVRQVVFNLDSNSAPGSDGFSGTFFTHCWDIIAEDIL
ncbi:uncharacterized protein [Coffea arabica]|uniref:Endonuclease/exonuclease/phosphatase domain-containing protein n=1 Tax=Coffea arabica TaxID=13443 RepID=A0ABM4VBV6_COFAR